MADLMDNTEINCDKYMLKFMNNLENYVYKMKNQINDKDKKVGKYYSVYQKLSEALEIGIRYRRLVDNLEKNFVWY
ncbi:hypothetical protein GOBAR_DD10857 [Gossypium barbadense]|nr:hypothetical protein GOBAR_DD10857 [Gossypium barbadense]